MGKRQKKQPDLNSDETRSLQKRVEELEKKYDSLNKKYVSGAEAYKTLKQEYTQLKKEFADLEYKYPTNSSIPYAKENKEQGTLYELHALVHYLSEKGTVTEQRMAYETFLKYVKDPVVKAAVYNNLGCIYSQVDQDFKKAREYYKSAVRESEKAAELDMDISVERLEDYRSNLYICEGKIRFAGRPGSKFKKKNVEEMLRNIDQILKES